ncbi:M1 family aminopeptidase [Actinomadura viridis]|uniref:M1 family aminopeptidase n=1 Tax=Actinomadura viridis TaxID=58110 RepID=UPI00369854A0
MTHGSPVTLTVDDQGVARLRLDRAERGNRIDPEFARAFRDATGRLAASDGVRAVVFSAAGPEFSQGGDLVRLHDLRDRIGPALAAMAADLHAGVAALAGLPAPVIAAVQGVAAGGGLGLVCAADIVLAGDSSRFSAAYTGVGLSPDAGTTWFLPRLVGLRRALDLTLGNRVVGAREALEIGLVTRVVADDRLAAEAEDLARALASGPTAAFAEAKRLLRGAPWTGLADRLADEAETIARVARSADGLEGVAAFATRRTPRFTGAAAPPPHGSPREDAMPEIASPGRPIAAGSTTEPPPEARAGRRVPVGGVEKLFGFDADQVLPGRSFPLPGDTEEAPRARAFALRHLRLVLDADLATRTLRGVATLTLTCLATGARRIELDAVGLEIEAVTLGGEAVPHETGPGRLVVPLGAPADGGTELTVEVRYRAGESPALSWREGAGGAVYVSSQGQPNLARRWFPCLDHPAERFTSELVVTVPRGLRVIAGGELIETDETDETATFTWRQDVAHTAYLVSLAAGPFVEVVLGAHRGTPLTAYGAAGAEDDLRRTFAHTAEIMAWLEESIGVPYPYAKYAQVIVPEHVGGAMENASATHFSDRLLFDERAEPEVRAEADAAVVHELAHQWFGNLWTCADWSHLWLQEGFCRFFEVAWLEHRGAADTADARRWERANWYYEEDRRYRRPLTPATFGDPFDVFDRHTYDKGGLLVHLLRHALGDRDFWRALREYARASAGRPVRLGSLLEAVERVTGRDVGPLLRPLVERPGYPELACRTLWEDGQLYVDVRQTQEDEDGPAYELPVEVAILTGADERRVRASMTGRDLRLVLDCAREPSAVVVDPERRLIASVPDTGPAAEQRYLAVRHPSVIGRLTALDRLREAGAAEAVPVVADRLVHDPFWGVRASAAGVLAALDPASAAGILLGRLDAEPDGRVRAAAVEALGACGDDALPRDRLLELLDDRSPAVEAMATRLLARHDDAGARARVERQLARPSAGEIIRAAALQGVAEGARRDAAEVIVEWSGATGCPQAREVAVALLASVELAPGEAEARLAAVLAEESVFAQVPAIIALSRFGGERALAVLRDRLGSLEDERARRRCREAIAMLEHGS